MKASDDLFELIHSLSRSEKAHFLSRSAGGEGKKYMELFRAVEKQDSYNEAPLKKKLGANNFSYTKHYLYNSILDSLHSYHAEEISSLQLNVLANQVDVLFRKGLHRQCAKLITRLRKQAYEREAFLLLLQIIPKERKLMSALGFTGHSLQSLDKLDEEETGLIKKYGQLVELSFHSNHLVYLQKTIGTPTGGKVHNYYNEVIKNLSRLKPEQMLSVKALIQYHHNLATAWFGKREFKKAMQHIRTNIDILLKHQSIFKDEEDRLVAHFNNLLTLAVDLKEWKLFDEYLRKMQAFEAGLSATNKQLRLRINERALAFAMRSAVERNHIKDGLKLEATVEQLLKTDLKETGPSYLIQWFFHLAVLHFLNNNLKAAAHWLQKLQYETDIELRRDIHAFGRCIELLIFYNEGNLLLIEPHVRSIRRQYQQLSALGGVEEALFRYLPKLTKCKLGDRKKVLTELQTALNNNVGGSSVVMRIVVNYWVAGQLKKK